MRLAGVKELLSCRPVPIRIAAPNRTRSMGLKTISPIGNASELNSRTMSSQSHIRLRRMASESQRFFSRPGLIE